MPEVYDYDDESQDVFVESDSPVDNVYIRDGLTDF
ncbi:hypothetical protein SEA_PHREDRICK_226 [Streptomyces phage Phredrick]|jgi:ferredoxin|nr:hypothetical protein SEA_PHREDRICK_226 [Streptomyces phage Phredrick]